jgi:histidinol-phosphate aminotransferase
MAEKYLRPDILAMAAYTPGEQVNRCIKLNTNECAWGPSPAVQKAISSFAVDSLRLYPDPVSRELREAAAAVYHVTPAHVLAGNGSDDCLTIIYRAFVTAPDKVACPWPTYSLYDTLASLQGVEIQHVEWAEGWRLPIDALASTGARVTLLATPNNPSATLVPRADLEKLAKRLDGILVVDEAYIDFAHDGDGLSASFLPVLDKYPNVIVLRTFSKSYSLAGARLGLLFAHPSLISQLEKVKDSYNVNALTQAAGTAALRDDAYLRDLVRKTLDQRAIVCDALREVGWSWPPSDANFVLAETGSAQVASEVYEGLKASGILVRYWAKRPDLNTKLRITIGSPESNSALIAGVKKILRK